MRFTSLFELTVVFVTIYCINSTVWGNIHNHPLPANKYIGIFPSKAFTQLKCCRFR